MILIQITNDQKRFEDFDKENRYGSDRIEKVTAHVPAFEPKACMKAFFIKCYGLDEGEAEDETEELFDDEMAELYEVTPEKIEMFFKHYGAGIKHNITFLNLTKIYGNISEQDAEAIANL